MCLTEYDEERVLQSIREEEFQLGLECGREEERARADKAEAEKNKAEAEKNKAEAENELLKEEIKRLKDMISQK